MEVITSIRNTHFKFHISNYFSICLLCLSMLTIGWKYNKDAESLKKAVLALPCDGIVEPQHVVSTAQRALACLPEKSIFKAVKTCRKELQAAIQFAERNLIELEEEEEEDGLNS